MPPTRKHLLLVAPPQSYRLAAYVRAASTLDIDLTVAAQGAFSLTREVAHGVRLDPADWPATLARLQQHQETHPFDGLVATDDSVVEQAARIGAELGLACNPLASARLTRRKDLARQQLRSAGVPVPDHQILYLEQPLAGQLAKLNFPVVLKPVSLSASQGVIRADTLEQAASACEVIQGIIANLPEPQERGRILAECYVPGREVALEGFLWDGKLRQLALFDKPDPLEGPFFEETYYITPSRHPKVLRQQLLETAEQACRAYGLRQGPVHIELRFSKDQIWVIELASRTIGGECSRVLDSLLEQPLEAYVVAAAIGAPLEIRHREGASGVLMIPIPRAGVMRRVTGVEEARAMPGIVDLSVAINPGQVVETLPESASYLGFIFARGDSPEQVETALRNAHRALRFSIDPLL